MSIWSSPSWILYFVIFWRPLFWSLVSTGLNKRPLKWYNSIVNDRKLWALQKKNIGMQKKNMKMSFVAAVNLLPSSIFCLSLPLYFFKLSRACLCSSSFMFRSSSLLVMNFMRDSHVVSSSVTLFEMLLWVKLCKLYLKTNYGEEAYEKEKGISTIKLVLRAIYTRVRKSVVTLSFVGNWASKVPTIKGSWSIPLPQKKMFFPPSSCDENETSEMTHFSSVFT